MSSIRKRFLSRGQIRRTESSGQFSSDDENPDKIDKIERGGGGGSGSDKEEKNDKVKSNPKRLKTRSLSNKVYYFILLLINPLTNIFLSYFYFIIFYPLYRN